MRGAADTVAAAEKKVVEITKREVETPLVDNPGAAPPGGTKFHPNPEPTPEELARLAEWHRQLKQNIAAFFRLIYNDGPRDPNSVGQPGLAESAIPIWGSGRAAVDNFQNGEYISGGVNTVLAITDIFLVKSLVTGVAKVGVKLAVKAAAKEAAEVVVKDAGQIAEKEAVQIAEKDAAAQAKASLQEGRIVFGMGPKTSFKAWEVLLQGEKQAQAKALVEKAAEIAGIDMRRVRVGFSPNAPLAFYEMTSDGRWTVVLDAKTLGLKQESSKLLVALHELMHHQDVEKFGEAAMRRLAGNPRYEVELEKRALELLQDYHKGPLPEETLKLHSDLMKLLNELDK